MAVVIAADPTSNLLRLNQVGAYSEPAVNTIGLGDVDDTEIEQFLTDWDAVSRAGFPSVNLSSQREVTGMSAAATSNDGLSQVSDFLELVFYQAHPLNAAKTITKSVQLRAPSSVVVNGTNGALIVAGTEGDRSSADESLRGVINYLAAHLIYEDVTGDITIGGWTWDSTRSKFGGSPFIADGQ